MFKPASLSCGHSGCQESLAKLVAVEPNPRWPSMQDDHHKRCTNEHQFYSKSSHNVSLPISSIFTVFELSIVMNCFIIIDVT